MKHITYSQYKNEYGGLADEEFFNKTRLEAEAFISAKTMGKVDKELSPELEEKVFGAVSLYINSCFEYDEINKDKILQSTKGIKSESVLSHSVTYEGVDFSKYQKDRDSKARKIVLEYLLPSGLLNTSVKQVHV